MARPRRSSAISTATAAALVVLLLTLAGLQYRWVNEIADAHRLQLHADLDRSAGQFRREISRELSRLAARFNVDMRQLPADGLVEYGARLQQRLAQTDELLRVEDIYFRRLQGDPDGGPRLGELLRLDRSNGVFEPAQKPADWPIPEELLRWRGRGGRAGNRGWSSPFSWFFFAEEPILVQLLATLPQGRGGRRFGRPRLLGLLIVKLDGTFLTDTVLADLARQYFETGEDSPYEVAVLNSERPEDPVYASTSGAIDWPRSDLFLPLLHAGEPPSDRPGAERGPGGPLGRRPFRGRVDVAPAAVGGEWMLAVRHREGSLEAAVDSFRNRNLAVSLSVLAMLAAALAMIVVSTRRSQRLAELQMGFVAGVSHELRTPLAVIRSAADNLADGLISSEDQVRNYGALIRDEGRRLTDMVEQTLTFASAQSGRREYKSERVDAAELVESVAAENAAAAAEAGFVLQTNIADGVQPIRGDAAAIRQSVSNLLRNAFKYGGAERWASLSSLPGNGETIIRVEDRGIGIEPADLPHVFEPFYRGRQATEDQVPGSGLGLSLARDAIEAMGGSLRVKSRPGRGSVFSLSLPVWDESQAENENQNSAG